MQQVCGTDSSIRIYIKPPPISREMEDIDAEIKRHEQAIHALKTQRNAATPICRLPVEILCEIFLLCRVVDKRAEIRGRWFYLPQACRYLRAVALACPVLWANLNFKSSPDWACEMLKRSKDAPLKVDVDLRYKTPAMRTVVFEALSNTSRIVELNLSGCPRDFELANERLLQPAPFMHSLNISSYGECVTLPSNFLGAYTPRLRSFCLLRCGIQLDTGILNANLTHLSIKSPGLTHATPSLVKKVLASVPLLETLELDHVLVPTDSVSYRTASRHADPIHLPKLSKLELLDHAPALTQLLFSLTIPPSVNVYVAMREIREPTLDSSPSPILDFAPALAALNSCTGSTTPFLHLPMESWEFSTVVAYNLVVHGWRTKSKSTICPPAETSVTVLFGYSTAMRPDTGGTTAVQAILRSLGDAMPLNDIRVLHLTGEDIMKSTFSVLECTTRLSSLCLRHVKDRSYAISALGSGDNEPRVKKKMKRAEEKMIFPNLRKLAIYGGDFANNGIATLRNMLRYRRLNKAKLGTLVLEDCSCLYSDDVDSLEKYVKNVEWDGVEYDPDEDSDEDYDDYYDDSDYMF